jgi:integrating conjugative element membrane protein (TIGR03745 family)
MKNVLKKGKAKVWATTQLITGAALLAATNVHAALPDTADPSNAAADGDYIGLMKGYAYDILIVVGLVLGCLAFTAVARNCLAVYSEISTGKKTWSDMGMHGMMGVLLLVFVIYLLTEAAGIIF